MAFDVILTEPARDDIDQAFSFIRLQSSVSAAERWLLGLYKALESLQQIPGRGAAIPERSVLESDYRHLLYSSYRIVFRVDEAAKKVMVLRIYHSARKPLERPDLQ